MNFLNIVSSMLKEVPELVPMYEQEMNWLEEELPYVIFGCVFNPYIYQLLSDDTSEDEGLQRVFYFIEQMANSTDEQVKQLLNASVLESLVAEKGVSDKARLFMGKKTLEFFTKMERAWGVN